MTNWIFEDNFKPGLIGWYAALKCWDIEEGAFPDAIYWDGSKWLDRGSAGYSFLPEVFSSAEEAKAWAYRNDPDSQTPPT